MIMPHVNTAWPPRIISSAFMLADPKSSREKLGFRLLGHCMTSVTNKSRLGHIVLQENYYEALMLIVIVVRFFLSPYN